MAIPKLTLEAQYDDLCIAETAFIEDQDCEIKLMRSILGKFKEEIPESKRKALQLAQELEESKKMISRKELIYNHFTTILQNEISKRKQIEQEVQLYQKQIALIREVLVENNSIDESTKGKLVFIQENCLSTIYENDLSNENFEVDDITENSVFIPDELEKKDRNTTKPFKPEFKFEEAFIIQNKEEEKDIDETHVKEDGKAKPSAISEVITEQQPFSSINIDLSPIKKDTTARFSLFGSKLHRFNKRIIFKVEHCSVCNNRFRISHSALKCEDCSVMCHIECKKDAMLPCVPLKKPPKNETRNDLIQYIGDTVPQVPPILVQIFNEIERRGLNEKGLYRISGKKTEIHDLKLKLFGRRRTLSTKITNIHDLCSVIKEFFRSLKEPLITKELWNEFVRASQISESKERWQSLQALVKKLPRPNRDTLAMLMLHLQKVAETPECKMNSSNLAKVLGPSVIGCSDSAVSILEVTRKQTRLLENLLLLPPYFWKEFLQGDLPLTSTQTSLPPKSDKRWKHKRFFPSIDL